MPLSDYAIRITYPYSALPRLVRAWSLHAKRMAFYEHNDDGAERIHCHAHVEDCDVTYDRLTQLAEEAGIKTTTPREGKRAGSLFACRRKEYDKNPSGYAYLTKGKYDASYLQGWTKEETDVWKSNWVPRANHIKDTPWRKLWREYEPYAPTPRKVDWEAWAKSTETEPPKEYDNFTPMETHARKWLFARFHGVCEPRYNTELSCIVNTYCMRHNITKPKGWRP